MSNELLGLTISNEDYHADVTRISKSGLDKINKSPLHYYNHYLDKEAIELRKKLPPKEWAKTGNAVGSAITEPDLFKENYVILDDSEICKEIGGARPTATNKYKEWMEVRLKELEGKTILTAAEYQECIAMRDAVHKMKAAKLLFSEGQAERAFYFTDPITGVLCRIKTDWLATAAGWVLDIKTSADASPDSFARSVAKFRYHVQDPFYMQGLKENGLDFKGFCFMVVEKEAPHATGFYFIPKEGTDQGKKEIARNLRTYAQCLEKNEWPGYCELLTEITLPRWAFD